MAMRIMPPLDAPGTFDSLRLSTNGITLHAAVAGPADGPLVILLHGFPEFWYGWRGQMAPLAGAGLRILAPDQRGYNLSDKPAGVAAYALDSLADDVLGLADALGRERFAVVGHDWGGVVAWHLAGRNPQRISRAIILNAPHPATLWRYARGHPTQLLKSWYVAYFQLPRLPELTLRAGGFWMLRRVLRRSSRPGTFRGAELAPYREAWEQPGALTAMVNWYRALRHDWGSLPPARIRVPLRVIWGDRDAFLDRGLAEAGIALCDRGEVFHRPLATHWVQHEEPDAVNRLLIDFLALGRVVQTGWKCPSSSIVCNAVASGSDR
jgi:pimeloyl-ACP methyl ester carboxylesterase